MVRQILWGSPPTYKLAALLAAVARKLAVGGCLCPRFIISFGSLAAGDWATMRRFPRFVVSNVVCTSCVQATEACFTFQANKVTHKYIKCHNG